MSQSLTAIAALLAGEGAAPELLRWEKMGPNDIAKIKVELTVKHKLATTTKMMAGLRGVLRQCQKLELLTSDQCKANLEAAKTQTAPNPAMRIVSQTEINEVFHVCHRTDDNASRRDGALLAIFLATGLRRSEAKSLDLVNYDQITGRLSIRNPKESSKSREIDLPAVARAALARWLEVRGSKAGPLLMPVNRGDTIMPRRLTAQAVYEILGRIALQAKLEQITGRDLRRAYVVGLIRSGKKVEEVQRLTGYASWLTNTAYNDLAKNPANVGYTIKDIPSPPATQAPRVQQSNTPAATPSSSSESLIEIERKFLVSGPFKHLAVRATRITQGYLSTDPCRTVRIRIRGDQGFITIKGPGDPSGMKRFEWERKIPLEEAKALLELAEPGVIDKTRYEIPAGEHTFEVDEFHGNHEGLVIAEIELTSEDEHFERPPWLSEEVTGDERYYNSALIKQPKQR